MSGLRFTLEWIFSHGRWPMALRLTVAIGVLSGMAGMCLHNVFGSARFTRDAFAHWSAPIAVVLLAAAVGLVRHRWWARWLGLAVGLAASILAGWLSVFVTTAPRYPKGSLVLLTGPLLLMSLSGRRLVEKFDIPAGWSDDARGRLVRWTVIANLSGLGALLFENMLFVREVLSPRFTGQVVLSLAAFVGLLAGAVLLARQKTAGLLVLAVGTALLMVSLGQLLVTMPNIPGMVLASAVAPGVLLAIVAVAVHAGPIVRFLREPGLRG